jgi:hypothetical protein
MLVGYVSTDGDIPHHDAVSLYISMDYWTDYFHTLNSRSQGNTTVNERSSHENNDITDESEDIDIPNHGTVNIDVSFWLY